MKALRQAIEAGDWQTAVALALTEWRKGKSREGAQVLERLTAIALEVKPRGPLPKSGQPFHALWRSVAKAPDPVDVGWLASTIGTLLVAKKKPDLVEYPDFLERSKRLRAFLPDPRITSAAMGELEAIRVTHADLDLQKTYDPVCWLLEHGDDASVVPRIKVLRASPLAARQYARDYLEQRMSKLEPVLSAKPASGGSAWWGLFDRLGLAAKATAKSFDEAALLQKVIDDLDDDGPRLVYGDACAANGDEARAIFIQLQCKKRLTAAEKRLMGDLFRQHRDTWLGPALARALVKVEFERGFPARAMGASNSSASKSVWAAAFRDLRLGTLTALDKYKANSEHFMHLVLSPAARNLTGRLTLTDATTFKTIAGVGRPLGFTELSFDFTPDFAALKAIATGVEFGAVRSMVFGVASDRILERLAEAFEAAAPWRKGTRVEIWHGGNVSAAAKAAAKKRIPVTTLKLRRW